MRDLNVLLISATNPFGHNHVLPRGLLREPISGLRRANVIVVTRANLVAPETLSWPAMSGLRRPSIVGPWEL